MRIVWTASALSDLRAIRRTAYSENWAKEHIRAIRRRALQLTDYPELGRVVPEFRTRYVRELIEGDYRIIYERFADRIEIVTIIHGARSFNEGPSGD